MDPRDAMGDARRRGIRSLARRLERHQRVLPISFHQVGLADDEGGLFVPKRASDGLRSTKDRFPFASPEELVAVIGEEVSRRAGVRGGKAVGQCLRRLAVSGEPTCRPSVQAPHFPLGQRQALADEIPQEGMQGKTVLAVSLLHDEKAAPREPDERGACAPETESFA